MQTEEVLDVHRIPALPPFRSLGKYSGCSYSFPDQIIYSAGSQLGGEGNFASRGHLTMSGDIFGCHDSGVLPAPSGERPGMENTRGSSLVLQRIPGPRYQ